MGELVVNKPRVFEGPIADAYQAATAASEPVFVPAHIYADDRGWSIMNQLQGVMGPRGQVNFSIQYPQVIKAWHRHERQTDFWLCLVGHLKVGIYREQDRQAWMSVIGEHCPGVMVLPPPLWHGAATVGSSNAGLLYYVTETYDPSSPDEQRRPHDWVAGFNWQVRHG